MEVFEMEGDKKHTTAIPPGIAAAATYFFPFRGGLVMLAVEKEDRFVRFHAAQSIVFWIIAIPIAFLSSIPILGGIIGFAFMVAWIFLMYQAWTNKEFEIPYLGAIARKQVFGDEKGPAKEESPAPEPGPAPGPEAPADGGEGEDPKV
jgi:uncharacterized membrane protein